MDGHRTRWDDWSAEQWLDEALRFEKMAQRFVDHPQLNASFGALAHDARLRAGPAPVPANEASRVSRSPAAAGTDSAHHLSRDLDYFRRRAAKERTAAIQSRDSRVRRAHLEMAERYAGLVRAAALTDELALRLVS